MRSSLAQPRARSRRCPPRRRSAPPSRAARSAFSTDGQRRCDVDRRSSAGARARARPGRRRRPPSTMRAISATVSSREAEMLKSSFSAGRRAHRGDDPVGDVVDVGQRARLLARAEDLQRPLAGEDLADQVGHRVGDPRLGVRQLARAVGVERAADRVRQAAAAVEGRQHVTHSQSAGHRVELMATFHQPGGGRRVEVGPQGDHHDVRVKAAGVGLDPALAGVDRPDRGRHEPYSGLDQVAVGVDHRVGGKPAEHHIEP